VNTPDKYGETALINASRAGRIETVKLKRYVERIKPGLDWDTVEARELALKKIQEIINRYKSEGVSAGGMGRTCFLFNEQTNRIRMQIIT
jgi:hypothetical protein